MVSGKLMKTHFVFFFRVCLVPTDSGQSNNANNVIYATGNRDLTFAFTDSSEEFMRPVSSVFGKAQQRFVHSQDMRRNMSDEDVFQRFVYPLSNSSDFLYNAICIRYV